MSTQDIYNYIKVSNDLITGGQPTEAQIQDAAAEVGRRVAGEGGVAHRQRAGEILDAAAVAVIGLVAGEDGVGHRQRTRFVDDAAAGVVVPEGVAVGDGEAGEGDGGAGAADMEDATGVVAADGQLFRPGAQEGQALG